MLLLLLLLLLLQESVMSLLAARTPCLHACSAAELGCPAQLGFSGSAQDLPAARFLLANMVARRHCWISSVYCAQQYVLVETETASKQFPRTAVDGECPGQLRQQACCLLMRHLLELLFSPRSRFQRSMAVHSLRSSRRARAQTAGYCSPHSACRVISNTIN
jgi:hypothetical protein